MIREVFRALESKLVRSLNISKGSTWQQDVRPTFESMRAREKTWHPRDAIPYMQEGPLIATTIATGTRLLNEEEAVKCIQEDLRMVVANVEFSPGAVHVIFCNERGIVCVTDNQITALECLVTPEDLAVLMHVCKFEPRKEEPPWWNFPFTYREFGSSR